MASFLKSLSSILGGRRDAPAEAPAEAEGHEHKGFTIRAVPYKEAGQYQTAGLIEKEVNGTPKTHKFIRADRFASLEDAVQFSLAKGRQLIDEQGERLFD